MKPSETNSKKMDTKVTWKNLPEIRKAAGVELSELAQLTSKTKQLLDLKHEALVRVTLHTAALRGRQLLQALYVDVDCADAQAAQKVVALASDVADYVSFTGLGSGPTDNIRFDSEAVSPSNLSLVKKGAVAAEVAAKRLRGKAPTEKELAALTPSEKKNKTPKGLFVEIARKAGLEAAK